MSGEKKSSTLNVSIHNASIEKARTPDVQYEDVTRWEGSQETDFGGESMLPKPPTLTPEQEKRLWRKVDLRLMPILTLMYLVSFLDRGNARLQGLQSQLHLTGINTILPCLVLKKFRPSRWLPGITVTWGIIMTLMGLVKNYPQLVGVRICLGVAEAVFPWCVYYLTMWYPRHELQFRIGIFVGAASLAGAFSGLLAYGISFMSGTRGLLGWSWIFILEGIATVVCRYAFHAVLVDFPVKAKFLTPEERAFVIWRRRYENSSVGEEEHFETRHVWAALSDWQVWLHILIYMSVVVPLYGITLFLPFGHTAAISQLLTVPPYVFATMVLYVFAYYSDKIKMRSPFILAGLCMCLIGFAINISNAPTGVKYFGTFFCVAGSYAAFPGVVAWLGNNLAGQYKRGIGMALHIGIGNFSGAIAANIYRSRDSPRFILGHGLELMFVGIGFVCLPIAIVSYIRINKARDVAQRVALEGGTKHQLTPREIRELGDRAPEFRYTL
ncbi:major facilitator superfamily domain-containing protein [Infundibulicybe gibba]|nr:major facilitator superfamily domain-containing protein [Infundibulicybe gibba]